MNIPLAPSLLLTTDHAASNYGQPVLVHNPSVSPQSAYGPADVFEFDRKVWPAAKHVQRFAAIHKDNAEVQEAAEAFCSQWPEGPQISR